MMSRTAKTFRSTLERMRSSLGWTIARVPFEVQKIWGTRGRLKVEVEIDGHRFRTSLFPTRSGEHFILVNKKMQSAAGVGVGATVEFRVRPDNSDRTVKMPDEFARVLAGETAMRRWFDRLNYSMRNYIAKWIAEPKQRTTRQRRAEQMAERLLATMEAEIELPPAVRAALASTPKASVGWQCMTASQRRHHLLGIFYYRNPESRARRIAKAVEAARIAGECDPGPTSSRR